MCTLFLENRTGKRDSKLDQGAVARVILVKQGIIGRTLCRATGHHWEDSVGRYPQTAEGKWEKGKTRESVWGTPWVPVESTEESRKECGATASRALTVMQKSPARRATCSWQRSEAKPSLHQRHPGACRTRFCLYHPSPAEFLIEF